MDHGVAEPNISRTEDHFFEEIGDICTIAEDVKLIDHVSSSKLCPELGVFKQEDSYSVGEDEEFTELNCDPSGTDLASSQVDIKDDCSTPDTSENKIITTNESAKTPPEKPQGKVWGGKHYYCNKEQLAALEEMLKETRYPDTAMKYELADRLGLTYTYVCKWFKARRAKLARQLKRKCSRKASVRPSKSREQATDNTSPQAATLAGSTLLSNRDTESGEDSVKKVTSKRTREQLVVLERAFKRNHYPDPIVIEDLSVRLGFTSVVTVRKWFASRRFKFRNDAIRRRTKVPNESRCSRTQLPTQTSAAGKQRRGDDSKSNSVKKTSTSRLSNDQVKELERVFEQVETPDRNVVEYLAEGLNLTPIQVKKWFERKRGKVRMSKPKKGTRLPRKNSSSKSQVPSQTANADNKRGISSQTGGSSASEEDEKRSLPRRGRSNSVSNDAPTPGDSRLQSSSVTTDRTVKAELSDKAVYCQVCDRFRLNFKLGSPFCDPCHKFMQRYKQESKRRHRSSVPPCSHKGTQVSAGCKGCRIYRYQLVTTKQNSNSPACKTTSRSKPKNGSSSQDSTQKRRSLRILAGSISCKEQETNDMASDVELKTPPTSERYPLDLQAKIHVTGKLNKLRRIATTLSNPEHMETKDRLILSSELDVCVDDLLSLVLGIDSPSKAKGNNVSSIEEPCTDKLLLPNNTKVTSCPILEEKIQSLEEVVKESITRIRDLEGQVQNSTKKEVSTQTDAYLLFSFVSQSGNHDKPSLPDEQPYNRLFNCTNTNTVQPSTSISDSPLIPTSLCLVCDRARPQAAVDHNSICTYCSKFMENLRIFTRSNHYLISPRCTHRGTHVTLGCKDCLLYRYNRVMAGVRAPVAQVDLTRSPPNQFNENINSHASFPQNTSRIDPEAHKSTDISRSHFNPILKLPQLTPLQSSLNYSLPADVQPAMPASTQFSLTLSQSTPIANTYQRTSSSNEGVPLLQPKKKCRSNYGPNYRCMWCDGCRSKKTCTRFVT